MKKLILILLCITSVLVCVGCSSPKTYEAKPDITQIRSICNLATLECYYHNVAKSTKTSGSSISDWFEKDREFWIEYTGVAKIGIDMSKINMEISDDTVTVHMPEAKLLSVDILETDLNEGSYIANSDNKLNPNKITAEDQTAAINNAQTKMATSVKENTMLLLNARIRAEKLIENYIIQVGDIAGISYRIKWVYDEKTQNLDYEK